MAYFIETYDNTDNPDLRAQNRSAHIAFLDDNVDILLACGAKIADDGCAVGGVYLVDLESKEQATAFIERDPFFLNGVLERVEIFAWTKGYFDRTKLL